MRVYYNFYKLLRDERRNQLRPLQSGSCNIITIVFFVWRSSTYALLTTRYFIRDDFQHDRMYIIMSVMHAVVVY